MAANTHSGRLERWLGTQTVEHLSLCMRKWYGPPIALAGVPGAVYACGDGDFRGHISEGYLSSAKDRFFNWARRWGRTLHKRVLAQRYQLNTGFASLSDLIAEATAGKLQKLYFTKVGTSGAVAGSSNTLWFVGN